VSVFHAGLASTKKIIEMHGFVDASNRAYAAVDLRVIHSSTNFQASLIYVKTKVAPVKTIP
jgi:hypothetical protein